MSDRAEPTRTTSTSLADRVTILSASARDRLRGLWVRIVEALRDPGLDDEDHARDAWERTFQPHDF